MNKRTSYLVMKEQGNIKKKGVLCPVLKERFFLCQRTKEDSVPYSGNMLWEHLFMSWN